MRFLDKIYRASFEDIVRKLISPGRSGSKVHNRYNSKEFLKSSEYDDLMSRHLPYDGSYDLHEAQNQTVNFRFRHFEARDRLGIFRWRGIQQNLEYIVDLITVPDKLVLDFGGAGCPLGFESKVVDRIGNDAWHRAVPYHSLSEIESEVDVIFSSHCLEHISEVKKTIQEMVNKLKRNGIIILHLPAFSCERWRAGSHKDINYGDHVWTFGLEGTKVPEDLINYVCIDTLIGQFLSVDKAEYCGDDGIFLICRN